MLELEIANMQIPVLSDTTKSFLRQNVQTSSKFLEFPVTEYARRKTKIPLASVFQTIAHTLTVLNYPLNNSRSKSVAQLV